MPATHALRAAHRLSSIRRIQAGLGLISLFILASCDDPVRPVEPVKPGALNGTVTDAFGAPVIGASIAVADLNGSLETGVSDSQGDFRIGDLSPGSYSVTAKRAGFDSSVVTARIASAATASIALSLRAQSLPSSALVTSRFVSSAGASAIFELDLVVVDRDANPISGLQQASFSIDAFNLFGTTITFANQGVAVPASSTGTAYTSILLIDQSGSMASTDPNGSRYQAAKVFLNALGAGDNVAVWAFASGGSLPFEVTSYGSGFTTNGRSLFGTVDGLRGLVAGGTPLYKATYAATDAMRQTSATTNRAVVVFTDGDDTQGGRTLAETITYAAQNGIKLFPVGLGTGSNMLVLGEMAQRTGGAVMYAGDARQLVSIFGSLGNILRGSAARYRVRWQVVRGTGAWGSGTQVSTSIRIVTPIGTVFAPAYFRVP
jgi:Carboxypeptidase regulatory-like domain/von Willebrand factor type A domain